MDTRLGRPRFLIYALPLLLITIMITAAGAQGFLPRMPSFGGSYCAPGHEADGSGDVKLGYLGYNNQGLVFGMASQGGTFTGIQQQRFQYPVQGLWLAASGATGGRGLGSCDAFDPGGGLCLRLGGSWLFPNNEDATESADFGTSLGWQKWRPTTQWYTLEASVSRCSGKISALIVGFRYDSFATNFADPHDVQNFNTQPFNRAELNLKSYIPYVGVVTRLGGLEAGVIGFPYVPGNVKWKKTFDSGLYVQAVGNYHSSYFLESFLEYGRQIQAVHLSAFAIYTLLHAAGSVDYTAQPPVGTPPPFAFTMGRQTWVVGGKATLNFSTPSLRGWF